MLCGAHILVSMDVSVPHNKSVWEGSYGPGWTFPPLDIHTQGKNAKYNSCIFHQDVVKAM